MVPAVPVILASCRQVSYDQAMSTMRSVILAVPRIRRLYDSRNMLIEERNQLRARLAQRERQLLGARNARTTQSGRDTATPPLSSPSPASSPFDHYNHAFDPLEVIARHAVSGLQPSPTHLTNFLGVRIDPKFLPAVLAGRAGEIEDLPVPANWHADIAEWGAALRAVDLARHSFTMIELGCGWGCWMNNTGVAARNAGLAVQLIGVEGDPGHIRFAREALAENGFSPQQINLQHGIAASKAGFALFPRQHSSGQDWGLAPVLKATARQRRQARRSGSHDELPMIALSDLVAPHPYVDLLHLDIQGDEADFIVSCLPTLQRKIAYLLIGTHSRQIEGRIMDTLLQAGWLLEIERPAFFTLSEGRPRVSVDGVQGWRNPVLLPSFP